MQPFDALKRLFSSPESLDFAAGAVSSRGLVRKENQDAIVTMPKHGLFAVADGMGGGAAGSLASSWIKEALEKAAAALAGGKPAERAAKLDEVLQTVNGRIRRHCKEQGYKVMGSTAALMLFAPSDRKRVLIMHVGDSRIYRLRGGALECLTRDHTVGVEMSRQTTSRREAAELSSRKNPLTHILTRAVGTEFKVRAQWRELDVERGDRYLLCTDGVHDMLDDATLAAALKRRTSPKAWVQVLASQVLTAGAQDNYSMIGLTMTKGKNP